LFSYETKLISILGITLGDYFMLMLFKMNFGTKVMTKNVIFKLLDCAEDSENSFEMKIQDIRNENNVFLHPKGNI